MFFVIIDPAIGNAKTPIAIPNKTNATPIATPIATPNANANRSHRNKRKYQTIQQRLHHHCKYDWEQPKLKAKRARPNTHANGAPKNITVSVPKKSKLTADPLIPGHATNRSGQDKRITVRQIP